MRVLLAAALVAVAGGAGAQVAAPFVEPSAWMAGLAQARLQPGYAALAARSDALAEALEAYCRTPDGAAPATARERWRDAALTLRRVSALPFGPALESRILRRIDFWPTRPPQIEASIVRYAAEPEATARIGYTARGLPALEYLLFDPERRALGEDAAACAYAAWLARDIAAALAPLDAAWRRWTEALAGADGEREAALLTDGVNILIGSVETLRLKYLEKPLGAGRRAQFDAWRSARTRAHLLVQWDGLATALRGERDVPGLADLLLGLGHMKLSAALEARVAAAGRALQALPSGLDDADRRPVERAARELARLQRLLGEEVAGALKVAVGFGESDGD